MKKLMLSLVLLSAPAAFAQYQYNIDPAHSEAAFTVKHMMISNVRGDFQKVGGTVFYDHKDATLTKINATIDTTTVSTRDPQRDGHLKSADFFDVAKYPTITFKSKRIDKKDGMYLAVGDLTMHGVTKEVTLTVDPPTPEVKDAYGFMRFGTHATTTVNRKDFGMSWNQAVDNGGVVVSDQVTIELNCEIARKPA